MKKTMKRVSLILLAIVFLFVAFLYGLSSRVKSELKKFTPLQTGEVVSGIYAVGDDFVNLYLIKSDKGYIAIDAANNALSVKRELKKAKIPSDSIVAVFLTHTDKDHVAALPLFRNARVYLSKDEVKMLTGEVRKMGMKNRIACSHYTTLIDNQTLVIGQTHVRGILTPGHTCGSMSYVVNDSCLFIGDALSLKAGKVGEFNHFFNLDNALAVKSIHKLARLTGVKYTFTAHYGYSSDFPRAFAEWK